ncbi:hypothetical protein EV363DRAFT_1349501 [Boletus edulis]|nr:hypothetical protein EV363DRAFT_1349501 [Boletus edulis]
MKKLAFLALFLPVKLSWGSTVRPAVRHATPATSVTCTVASSTVPTTKPTVTFHLLALEELWNLVGNKPSSIFLNLSLPEGFIFGVATRKGLTMWDWVSRPPGFIQDNTTADITDLHYYLYKEDAARVAAIGVTAQSFS